MILLHCLAWYFLWCTVILKDKGSYKKPDSKNLDMRRLELLQMKL